MCMVTRSLVKRKVPDTLFPPYSLILGEGAGFDWLEISKLSKMKLTEKTERDLKTFMQKIF